MQLDPIKIVHLEPRRCDERCRKLLNELGTVEFVDSQSQDEIENALRGHEASCLFVRIGVSISRRLIQSMPNLEFIVTPTTGLTHIDLNAAQNNGIEVVSLQGETEFLDSIRSTAEHTWAILMALTRRVPEAVNSARSGHWRRDEFVGTDLHTKKLGIIGLGRLGRMVAGYGLAFGMNVIFCDVLPDEQLEVPEGVHRATLTELLAMADVVCLHVPYNESTHDLIGSDEIASMKPGAYFVNTSRGEVVDESALREQLANGHIGGAALDVLVNDACWSSSVPQGHWIRTAGQRLVVTPHIGGYARESIERTRRFMIEKIRRRLWSKSEIEVNSSPLSGEVR